MKKRIISTSLAAAMLLTAFPLHASAEDAPEKARAIGDGTVNFSKEVDVLVVGAGISGMFAAIEPAKAGLNVLIVEQNSMYGGDAIYSAACQMCSTAKLTQEERPDKYMSAEQIRERFAPYYPDNEAGLNRIVLLQDWAGRFIDKMHYEWGYEFQPLRESPYHQAFFPKDGLCTMKSEFDLINEKEHLNQQLIPYFISSHPDCYLEDMAELALKTKELGYHLEQVQDFTPTPMTLATEIYYSGYDPYTLEPVFCAKTKEEKLAQQRFFFWYKPENREWVKNALRRIGHPDWAKQLFK